MELLGDLILIVLFLLVMLCAFKFAKLYCMAIDELLCNISKAVRGEYKSKYKEKGK